jgi:hypothetical protein
MSPEQKSFAIALCKWAAEEIEGIAARTGQEIMPKVRIAPWVGAYHWEWKTSGNSMEAVIMELVNEAHKYLSIMASVGGGFRWRIVPEIAKSVGYVEQFHAYARFYHGDKAAMETSGLEHE